jgi:hypothetical protein
MGIQFLEGGVCGNLLQLKTNEHTLQKAISQRFSYVIY